ncbi:chemotaxis protein CheB [Persicobacter psychrovividus]|uniref:protein-glutamate methylesterase n=1 Tax=Persicobacter psychrovividus TaxID=387638 RepID=A0ABN6L8U2_9BACT|nr:chemotaxis protein CheB [Persicobacter psychrovividus]
MKKYAINDQYKAVVIGGSAGSFQGITKLLSALPEDFPLPIILCLHRLKHVRNGFVEALDIKSTKKIYEPLDKEPIKRGKVYLAPSNYHLCVELGNYFSLSTEEMINNSRPAIDITLGTCAYVYRHKLIGILLSGANRDGGAGMAKIAQKGGLTIVQNRAECMIPTMPQAALDMSPIDYELTINEITDFLNQLHKTLKG